MTYRELVESKGIRTVGDLDRKRGNKSRYGWLLENLGHIIAGLVLRDLEVRSWKIPGTK